MTPGSGRSLEKGMAVHSRILAWRIPWTEEPAGCSPWGRKDLDSTTRLTLRHPPLETKPFLGFLWLSSPRTKLLELFFVHLCELQTPERSESSRLRKMKEVKLPCFLPNPTGLRLSSSSPKLPATSKGRRAERVRMLCSPMAHSLHLRLRVPAGGWLGGSWSSAPG